MKKTHKGTLNRTFALVMGIALTFGLLPGVSLRAFASEAEDAPASVVDAVEAADLTVTSFGYAGTYDGEAHAITITVENEGAEAEFWYGAEELTDQNYETVGSKNPVTRTDVGTTTVYYYVCADGYAPVSGSETITIKAAGEGGVETETKVGKDAPIVAASNLTEVANGLLTEDDRAAIDNDKIVTVSLRSSALKATAVPKADKEALEKEAAELGAAPGTWMDLSLYKQVTDQDRQTVKETSAALECTVTVPESLKNTNKSKARTFYLIECHDGKAALMAQSTDTELKGEINKFSTFLIAYADKDVVDPTPTPTPTPTTDMYTLTFDANGGTGTMDSMTLRKGEAATLPANEFDRKDYVFTGWNTRKNGTGTRISDGGKVLLNSDVTLYAQWMTERESQTSSNANNKYSIPEMSNSTNGYFASTGNAITYTILQKVPSGVKSMRTWVDLEGVLQYTTDASGVTVQVENGDPINASVAIDGQRLIVAIDDVTSLQNKTIRIVYSAKVRSGADLSSYTSSGIASVPYQAHTVFDNDENNVLTSTREVVKFSVGSGSSSGSTSSGGSSRTSTNASTSTLAKTADPTSVVGAVVMALSGAAALACSKRKAA
jgi:fimbrial isopeptide formation D2 family protein/uncharacterized repeat protein (TIGR02543 family)